MTSTPVDGGGADSVRGRARLLLIGSVLAALALLLSACGGVPDEIADLNRTAADKSRPRVAVVAHPGLNPQNVLREVRAVLTEQLEAQGSLDIQVMGLDGSASTMTRLDIGDGGSLFGSGHTEEETEAAREVYHDEIDAQLVAAIGSEVDDTAAAELLEALERAVQAAQRLDGNGTRRAVLVTGGGIHRTPGLDFYTEVDAAAVAAAVADLVDRIGGAEVAVEIVGVSRLAPGANPDLAMTSRVDAMWADVCTALEENETDCDVRN